MGDHRGPLIIIGGGEDKEGHARILARVVEAAGGPNAAIGVLPTASEAGNAALVRYREVFTRLGAREVRGINLTNRLEADDKGVLGALDDLSAVFFTGGDQLRITSALGGTTFHHRLLERHQEGLLVAGTSAGASMMTDTMIVEGDAEEAPTLNTVHLARGMGFWSGAVVDQHFSQRGRIGRLLAALAQNPEVLGVGIDENTAIEVDFAAHTFRVVGTRTVTVLDGRQIVETNASESSPEEALAVTGVVLHVLPEGFAFDWDRRRPARQREPVAAGQRGAESL
ncbi:MAG: cyanophycinase [Clostridia bacterium]